VERQHHLETMKPHRILLLAAGIGTVALCTAQQLPITTQYLFNGLLINPAYAGSRKALTANLTWRQQWAGFEGAPRTQVLSIHSPLPEKKLALGLLLINDRIGVAHETAVTSNYAYRIRLGRGQLAFGLGAGVRMQAYEWTGRAHHGPRGCAIPGGRYGPRPARLQRGPVLGGQEVVRRALTAHAAARWYPGRQPGTRRPVARKPADAHRGHRGARQPRHQAEALAAAAQSRWRAPCRPI
jgi:hypothetical protein